jgi:hypothetical protein
MYKLHNNPTGQSIGVFLGKTYIPFDLENSDYQAYLAWVAQGNTPQPADEVTK